MLHPTSPLHMLHRRLPLPTRVTLWYNMSRCSSIIASSSLGCCHMSRCSSIIAPSFMGCHNISRCSSIIAPFFVWVAIIGLDTASVFRAHGLHTHKYSYAAVVAAWTHATSVARSYGAPTLHCFPLALEATNDSTQNSQRSYPQNSQKSYPRFG